MSRERFAVGWGPSHWDRDPSVSNSSLCQGWSWSLDKVSTWTWPELPGLCPLVNPGPHPKPVQPSPRARTVGILDSPPHTCLSCSAPPMTALSQPLSSATQCVLGGPHLLAPCGCPHNGNWGGQGDLRNFPSLGSQSCTSCSRPLKALPHQLGPCYGCL